MCGDGNGNGSGDEDGDGSEEGRGHDEVECAGRAETGPQLFTPPPPLANPRLSPQIRKIIANSPARAARRAS